MVARRGLWRLVTLTLALGLAWAGVRAQVGPATPDAGPVRTVVLVIDASGSMAAPFGGGQSRLAAAQDALAGLARALPADGQASLWAFGHRLPQDDAAASCRDIENIAPLAAPDADAFTGAARALTPRGYTPLGESLRRAAASIPPQSPATIVLLSDGEETCGADPCAIARALAARHVGVVINTIGLAPNAATREQLMCLAAAAGGAYYDAPDAPALAAAFAQAAQLASGTIRVVDAAGQVQPVALEATRASADGAPVTVASAADGVVAVPPGAYTVLVRGGPTFTQAVVVGPGETVDVVQGVGVVQVLAEDGLPAVGVPLFVYLPDGFTTVQNAPSGRAVLPPGRYSVKITPNQADALPVTVTVGGLVPVLLGAVRAVDVAGGVLPDVPLQVLQADGQTTVLNAQGVARLLPGRYVVRANTQPPAEATVTVLAGATVTVQTGVPATPGD